ncbi:MAG: hypothetical protein ACLFPD_06410 [Desulfosudaceae bacterium]
MTKTLAERAALRRKKMSGHLSRGFVEAEEWDLSFWLDRTPQERLSALVAIRRDIEKVNPERLKE